MTITSDVDNAQYPRRQAGVDVKVLGGAKKKRSRAVTRPRTTIFSTDLANAWMSAPNFKRIRECECSVEEYSNIKVGEDFKGYKK